MVNGYTGAIAGDRPLSYVKVFHIILPILILLLLVFFSQQ